MLNKLEMLDIGTKTMKPFKFQESHHTKEETTWEHEDDFQED